MTPYTNNRSARVWLDGAALKVPSFANLQPIVSDLLDMYMEYKTNLAIIHGILNNMKGYKVAVEHDAIKLNVSSLVHERKEMKDEMRKIVKIIEDRKSVV